MNRHYTVYYQSYNALDTAIRFKKNGLDDWEEKNTSRNGLVCGGISIGFIFPSNTTLQSTVGGFFYNILGQGPLCTFTFPFYKGRYLLYEY